jgi:hypothetical protein
MSDAGLPAAGWCPMNRSTVAFDTLRTLAEADARLPPPYDFAEFTRRRERRAAALRVRRTRLGRITAIAASFSVALLGTALWRLAAVAPRLATSPAAVASVADDSPALVSVDQLAARDSLEERIALIDAMLNESRIAGAQDDTLRAMERGRSTLVDSLQRVSYAHELIGP